MAVELKAATSNPAAAVSSGGHRKATRLADKLTRSHAKKNNSLDAREVQKASRAYKFRYTANAPSEDIEKIRQLLAIEHYKVDETRRAFFTSDFQRLLTDDWLVSRFLFKGYKEARKNPQNGDALEQTLKRMAATADFRYEYRISNDVSANEFPLEWRMVGGLLVGEPDFEGNPMLYFRIALHRPKLIADDEHKFLFRRLFMWTMDLAERNLVNNTGKALAFVFDYTNVSYDNYDMDTVMWLAKIHKTIGPKIHAYAIVYNLPWIFSVPFKVMSSTFISGSNR